MHLPMNDEADSFWFSPEWCLRNHEKVAGIIKTEETPLKAVASPHRKTMRECLQMDIARAIARLEGDPRLEQVTDDFLVACRDGLRSLLPDEPNATDLPQAS